MYKAVVLVKRRKSILDPQGKGVEQGAKQLGFTNIRNIRVDKQIEFMIDCPTEDAAKREVDEFCNKLLANPVMEDYEIKLEPADEY